MIVKSLALSDFRNYDLQELSFHHGINIFYGDNAQGKTNILEGIYLCMTNKSYRGSHDREMIRFGKDEAHLRLEAEKKGCLSKQLALQRANAGSSGLTTESYALEIAKMKRKGNPVLPAVADTVRKYFHGD